MAFPEKNYTLGSGKLYFDKFVPGTKTPTGQRYIGNTPELNLSSESESLEHFDSDNGLRQKDKTVLLELGRNGSFITDHISPANLAMFFLAQESVVTQASAIGQTSLIENVSPGLRYQIGKTVANPAGARGLANVVVEVGAVTMVLGTDYTLDTATGGIVPLATGAIVEGDDLDITYDLSATSFNKIVTGAAATIEGQLFFYSNNGEGEKFDYFWPHVSLTPDGDFALKGEEWQQIGFTFEALKLDDQTEVVYINGRPGAGV